MFVRTVKYVLMMDSERKKGLNEESFIEERE